MGLRHLSCSEMQSLRVSPGNSLLEPIHSNRFLRTHELNTEDDADPIVKSHLPQQSGYTLVIHLLALRL